MKLSMALVKSSVYKCKRSKVEPQKNTRRDHKSMRFKYIESNVDNRPFVYVDKIPPDPAGEVQPAIIM